VETKGGTGQQGGPGGQKYRSAHNWGKKKLPKSHELQGFHAFRLLGLTQNGEVPLGKRTS